MTWAYSETSAACSGSVGHLAVEGDVPAPAQQPCRRHHHGGVLGVGRVEGADEVGVDLVGRPLDVERLGGALQAVYVSGVRRRQRAEQADLRLDHERGGAEAGQQGDLGVPQLDREHAAELQRPLVALDVHLLLRQRERDPAAQGVALDPQLADLLEQQEHLAGRAVLDRLLRALVAQLRRRPHPCALDEDLGALAGLVDLDRPQQGRPDLVGDQRAGVLGDRLRVQRHLRVGAVEGLAALVRLQVDRVTRGDERRHVGDGVVRRRSRRRSVRCGAPGRGPSRPRGRS